MELIRNYFLILLIIALTRHIDGGVFKQLPLHESSEPQETIDELDEKEVPLAKRQSLSFYDNNPFFSYSTFVPQQEHTQVPNTQFINYQKPIKVPIQVPPQQSFVNYGNNPFISGSVSVPVLPVTSAPVVASTPSYVNNPFLNTQQVNSNVNNVYPVPTVTTKPVITTLPSFSNNPFINVNTESVHTSHPVQVTSTTTVRPLIPSSFTPQQQEHTQIPNNQFNNYQKPIVIPIQEFSKFPPQQSFVNYGNNPFISGSVSVPVSPVTSTPVVTSTPSYVSNPFLNVHSESVQTSHPVQVPSTTTAKPTTFAPLNTNNPFFNPSIVTVPVSTNGPIEIHRQPIEVQVQLEQSSQLRSFCAKARGQFPSGRCNTFVNCWDNVAVEQSCPPGLVFNFAGYCDYPQNVDCYGRSVEEIPVPQTPQTVSFVVNGQTGTNNEVNTPAPFYPGVNTDTTFVPSSTILPPLPDVTVPPVVYVPPPVDEKLKAKCLKPRGQFPSDLCNRYIDCWDDSIKEYECPEGLYFSEKGYCDYSYNVNCQNRTLPKADVSQSSLCPNRDGSFQDKNNCSKYFICINNVVAGYYECPEGLYFNQMVGVCDYKYNVHCFKEPFVYQPPQTQNHIDKIPAGVLTAAKNCEPGKVFKLADDCSSAVLCRQGMTEVVYCPNGLAYDPPSDRCLPQHLAKCQDI
ncbi:hypothetical protein RN001_006444 [Aquatica leii]|uniref:Chitin-binding type-2 domain-containing protein n=1 Tax=Aquatica leii TaxID=1421715 RepID=A0AAN7SS91_9COLE|nr:hypothetical protein RN001_006444 [Aquatica leii]